MNYIELPEITLKMLIDESIISPGTTVYGGRNNDITGIIVEEGAISLIPPREVDNKNYRTLSGAAKAVNKGNTNGWIFWKIKHNDEYRELNVYRQEYIQSKNLMK